jgi:hypothetical protein
MEHLDSNTCNFLCCLQTTLLRHCRDTMTRLLSRVGNGTSIPYMFAPGNHEVGIFKSPIPVHEAVLNQY